MAFTYKHGDRPLEGYQILRGVGRGGFGEVYYAVSDGGREVALKYLRENPEVELRGISSCINLKSPHLVSIFDVRRNAEGEYFVIMEYVSGPSLRDLLIAEPTGLGAQKAAFFIREIGKGLGYLHDRGIVHRDLKPGNIFYEDGYVKICDYGLSKFISVSRRSAQTASVGTVHYMAPEVGSGNYSKTIDIYAVGVILYEMLLGRVPYEGASMGEVLMKHLTSQPEVDQLPQPFASVIRKALAKDAADRYPSIGEMVEAIFGEEDVRRSVLGFEPASLSQVAAQATRDVRPSPVPSDNPMPLPGPARPRLIRSGHDFSRRFVERTAGLNPRLSRKERRRQKRREKKQARQVELLGIEHDAEGQVRTGAGLTFGQRLARVLTAFLMMGGACTVIGILTGEAEVAAVSLGVITLALLGIGVAHAIANYIGPDHPWLIDRVLTVACAAPAVGLLYTFQSEPGMPGVEKLLGRAQPQVPLLAALALLDWRQRIRQGHEGELGWWPAYIAAVVPWVGTMVLDHGNWNAALYLGGLGASVSLLLQVWAWALASSPRPHGAHPDAAASPRTAPGQDETQWAPPPQSAPPGVKVYEAEGSRAKVRVELGMPGSWRPAAGGTSSEAVPAGPDPGRVRRGRLARGVAWVCCVTFGLETLALIWLICRGAFDYEQTAVAIVAACAAMMTSWMALGKTHPLRRPGRWSEWFNPALRILAGSTLAGGVCVLSMFHLGEGQLAAAITMVVLSSLALLFLLIVRRRRPRAVDVMQVPAMHRAAGAPAVEPAGRPDSADSPEANDFIIPAPARKS